MATCVEVVLLAILVDAFHRHLVGLGGLEDPEAVLGRSGDGAAGGAGDQGHFGLLGDFQHGHGGVGYAGADDGQAILVLGQLGGVEPGLGDVAFVVVDDQLQGMPIDAALGVDCFGHHLQGIPFGLPEIGGRAADGKDAAHHVGLGLLGAAAAQKDESQTCQGQDQAPQNCLGFHKLSLPDELESVDFLALINVDAFLLEQVDGLLQVVEAEDDDRVFRRCAGQRRTCTPR